MFENLFPLVPSKSELRTHLKSVLTNLDRHERAVATEDLNKILSSFLQRQSGIWAAYCAHQEEVSVEASLLKNQHITWSYPVMQNQLMKFYQPGQQGMKAGEFGILQPVVEGAKAIALEQINGILIPGLGFDVKGYRLGRGKGFFDQTLENYKGLKVGISFSKNFIEELPRESHDVRMDFLITEKGIIQFTN